MESMADWQQGAGYKMIVVCDKATTYNTITKNVLDVPEATEDDSRKATKLLAETTMILADSLVESCWSIDEEFESTDEKIMLGKMKDQLMEQKTVKVPSYALVEGVATKLYTIDYSTLYQKDPKEKRDIPDPFLVLIKAAVNLSAFCYENGAEMRTVWLLPGCSSLCPLTTTMNLGTRLSTKNLCGKQRRLVSRLILTWSLSTGSPTTVVIRRKRRNKTTEIQSLIYRFPEGTAFPSGRT
jgi:hypothetical protein